MPSIMLLSTALALASSIHVLGEQIFSIQAANLCQSDYLLLKVLEEHDL